MVIRALTAATVLCGASFGASAQTLYDRTYVASTGTANTTCSRAAPCSSFTSAINSVKPGGEILCIDRGDYGGLLITKEVTVDCTNTLDTNGLDASRGAPIVVAAGLGEHVTLRGFVVHSNIVFNSGTSGIDVTSVGVLTLDKVRVVGQFNTSGNGIFFQPSNAGAKLVVNDSVFLHAGNSSGGAGIRVSPQPGGTAQVALNQVLISGSTFGLALDGAGSTGGINATVVNSVLSANANDGIVATTSAGAAPIGVAVINSQSINNGFGIRSIGSNVTVRVQGSQIIGNGAGLSGGGALLSGGGNTVQANGSNGSFTGSYMLQ